MYSNKDIWKISYPIFLSLLAQNIINVTDTAFLGRVGEIELGASAIAGIYYIVFFMICFGFSIGAQIMIGRRNGEEDYRAIGPIMIQGVIFLFLTATLLFTFSYSYSDTLMSALVSSEKVSDAATVFLKYRLFGFFFSSINVMFRAFYVGITKTRVLTINAVIMAIVNIIFDYLLIFGKFGFPELGIAGAAIASVLAEMVSVIFFISYTAKNIDLKKYGLLRFRNMDFGILRRVLSISVFTMFQSFISMSTFLFFFMAVEKLGEIELAASNLIRSIYLILFIPIQSLATTTNTIVSNTIGAGQKEMVIPVIRKISSFNYKIVTGMVLLLLLFPEAALSVYTDDTTLIEHSVAALRVLGVSMLICGVGNIYFAAVSGTGNTRAALWLESIALVIYVAYIFFMAIYLRASLAWCWTSEMVYWSLVGSISYLYLRSGKWKRKEI